MERTHTQKKRLFCPICRKVFDGPWKLKTHLRTHEKKEKFQCLFCNAVFAYYGTLCTHVDHFHKFEKQIAACTCDLCGVDYYSTTRLDSHMKSNHSGVYKCFDERCRSRFQHVISLKNHFLIHHKESVEVKLLKILKILNDFNFYY